MDAHGDVGGHSVRSAGHSNGNLPDSKGINTFAESEIDWGPVDSIAVAGIFILGILFVGMPMAIWWWIGDVLREWSERNEQWPRERKPDPHSQNKHKTQEEGRECPY